MKNRTEIIIEKLKLSGVLEKLWIYCHDAFGLKQDSDIFAAISTKSLKF